MIRYHYPLSLTIPAFTFLIGSLLTGVLLIYVYITSRADVIEGENQFALNQATLVAGQLDYALRHNELDLADRSLDNLKVDRAFLISVLVDDRHQILLSSSGALVGRSLDSVDAALQGLLPAGQPAGQGARIARLDSPARSVVLMPVLLSPGSGDFASNRSGMLVYQRDLSYALGRFAVTFQRTVLLVIGVLLTTCTLLWLMQRAMLFKRLDLLLHEALHGSGSRPVPMPLDGNDELSIIMGRIRHYLDELRQKSTQIYQSEKLFRGIFEQTAVGMALVTPDGRFQTVNRGLADLLQYNSGDLEKQALRDIVFADDREREAILADLAAIDLTPEHSMELRLVDRSAKPIWVSVTLTAVHNDQGDIDYYISVIKDISKRKSAELALQTSYEALEERVKQRTRDLEIANDPLKGLDRLKSMFIASMSHELRTPLNSVIGFTGMLLKEIPGSVNAKQRDYLRRIAGSGQYLLSLITDIIDVAKLESGKARLYVERFDLGVLIREAVASIQTQVQDKGLTIEISAPEGVCIASDRRRVMQCLLNYLNNALKYTQKGGIRVNLTLTETPDVPVQIAVIDTGIGIAVEDQAALFKQFSRIDSPITRRTPGTGLGLYLTRKLATELLGGKVSVASEPGKGSEFRLHLPLELAP